MISSIIPTLLLLLPTLTTSTLLPRAVNGPCTDLAGNPGVCISTADCTSGGGTHTLNRCPSDPDNVRCCTKSSCGSDSAGVCKFASSCSGTTEANFCPGPSTFKCCKSGGGGTPPGGNQPSLPSLSSGCKQVAIDGARKIITQFPGKVLEIGCKRKCGSDTSSQHCTGMANDLMVGAYGSRSDKGQEIAEWVMRNRGTLSLRYVIWGQKIWQPSTDAVAAWASWKGMEDRGSNTANHWDHVHVSYN